MPDPTPPETPEQMRARRAREGDFYVSTAQDFDVILLKKGVSSVDALPDDYKRVHVRSDNVSKAMQDETVVAAAAEGEGFEVLQATAPGFRTEGEIAAQKREHDAKYRR
jgi:hypothetical protein